MQNTHADWQVGSIPTYTDLVVALDAHYTRRLEVHRTTYYDVMREDLAKAHYEDCERYEDELDARELDEILIGRPHARELDCEA